MATDIQTLKQGTNSQDVAKRPKTIFDLLTGDKKVESAIAAVASQFMTPDRFLRLAVNAVKKTPLLLECDPQTVLGSFMASAALGLEPNTVQQQAFLIPYSRSVKKGNDWVKVYDCQFQVGYRGFITLAHRSPHINSLQAEAIHENDLFDHMLGTESFLKYRKAMKDRGELIGAFAYSRLASGVEIATVLPLTEIHKIRSKSETYNSLTGKVASANGERDKGKAEQKLADTPWVLWEDDMSAKSAIKKHAKQLPLMQGEAIAAAVQLDTDGDDRIIDMAAMVDPDAMRSVMNDGFAPEQESSLGIEHQAGNFLHPQTIRPLDTADVGQQQSAGTTQRQHVAESAPAITFAKLNDRFLKATDIDVLDADATLIREVVGPELQDELTSIYKECRKALENPAPKTAPAARQRTQMNIE